jgi:hypothetical protein
MPRYAGHLTEKGPPERSVAVYSFESDMDRQDAIARLVTYAEKTMEIRKIDSATLVVTENDIVVRVRTLESRTNA